MSLCKHWRLFIVLALLIGLTGCGSETYIPALTSISISPPSAQVAIGETQEFTATAKDQKGKAMSGDYTFAWTVVPEEKGEIDDEGVFTAGDNTGSCNVLCATKGITAQAQVTVYDPEEPPAADYSLVALGEQVVDDTRRVGETVGYLLDNKISTVMASMEEQLLPHLPAAKMALDLNIGGIEWFILSELFYFTPGEVYTWEDMIYEAPDEEELQTGTWTVTLEDGWWFEEYYEDESVTWTYIITRSVVGDTDIINYTITNDYDSELLYQGTATYPTAQLGEEAEGIIFDADITTMEDSVLALSTLKAEIILVESTLLIPTIFANIESDFRFKGSDDYLKLNGGISLQFSKDADDYFTGTMETADLKLTGEMNISYVENANTGIFPSSLSVNGETQIMGVLLLDGEFSLEVGNAATYNPVDADYSADNWPKAKITFSGQIWGNQDTSMAAVLSVEETAFYECIINMAFDLNDGGVSRQLTITVNSEGETPVINVEINSTWGPARIVMEITCANGFNHSPTDVEGTVEIDEVEVGEISLGEEGLRVDYIDDTFETF